MKKARQFYIASHRARDQYEKIINDRRCKIYERSEHTNRDGDIIIYIEFDDLRPEEDQDD